MLKRFDRAPRAAVGRSVAVALRPMACHARTAAALIQCRETPSEAEEASSERVVVPASNSVSTVLCCTSLRSPVVATSTAGKPEEPETPGGRPATGIDGLGGMSGSRR